MGTPLKDTPVVRTDHLDAQEAGELSTLFDVGGIFGESLATALPPWKRAREHSQPRLSLSGLAAERKCVPRVHCLSGRVPSCVLGPDPERGQALYQAHSVGGGLVGVAPSQVQGLRGRPKTRPRDALAVSLGGALQVTHL